MKKKVYLYMLTNKKNGTLYTGATTDLVKRTYAHKNRLVKGFTYKYNLTKLIYIEVYDDIETAFTRERRIKGWKREWKIRMIEKVNPEWLDLFDTLL